MESIDNESIKSLKKIILEHDDLFVAHTSGIAKVNEQITAELEELMRDYKQECDKFEAANKILRQRENEFEKLSYCKQLDSHPSKKESEDLKKELVVIYKQIAELEEQLKAKTESLHGKSMELEIALQVKEDVEGMDPEETLENLQSELKDKGDRLQELKNLQKNLTLDFNVKNDELQDATRELISGLKGNSKRSRIGVKKLDDPHGKGGLAVEELWHNKENRIASLKEGIEYIIKQWKTEKKRVID
ncbi:factor of DNA methylation 4 [Artemisia annua]|uniref:Factor of DNA methylation 4 n=1 Tax=Artemisia annua TaxID=35608 RepID=A0A2U1LNV5_ARTAN|nr:factor of DNA methylation 4 [Artemisia annua]